MSVPAFGDWDMKNGVPDYSMDFSKIREKRKQNKSDFFRASLGNDQDFAAAAAADHKAVNGSGGRRRDDYAQLPDHSSESAAAAAAAHSPSVRIANFKFVDVVFANYLLEILYLWGLYASNPNT